MQKESVASATHLRRREREGRMGMPEDFPMKVIAHMQSDFPEKFGIPRQSGMVEELKARILFLPEYRNPDAFRGLEEFSHIWLLWEFSQAVRENWSPTVRPPRLGGNLRKGVFATRSPFRPNPIGLSCVRLDRIVYDSREGPVLYVSGADLMDGTPIFDIKPYLPHVDSRPDAVGGFAEKFKDYRLSVEFPEDLLKKLPESKRDAIVEVLAQDPRPSYQKDPERMYGVSFAGYQVRFQVEGQCLQVREVEKTKEAGEKKQ